MIVEVRVLNSVVKVSCGEGKQSFKWLASVVQSRIQHSKITRSDYENENYIVTEIRNASGELLNPVDRIYEHAGQHGLEVTATTSNLYPVDEWENPQMGDWLKGAYLSTETGKRWFSEIEAWRETLSALNSRNANRHYDSERNSNILSQRFPLGSSSLIKIGFDFSERDIAAAFDLDWVAMRWEWMDNIVGGLTERERSLLGGTLKEHYSLICNVFTHYCGTGQVGQRYGLTLREFSHLLHFMRIHNLRTHMADIEEAFLVTGNISRRELSRGPSSSGNNKWPLMTRAHLSQALVYVALKENVSSSPSVAMLALLSEGGALDAFWADIASRYLLHTCGEEDSAALKKTTGEHHQLLRQAFNSRATVDALHGPSMSLASFVGMLVESGLIEPEQEPTCVHGYLQAHLSASSGTGGSGAGVWELHELVLSEFIEALSRVAVKVIDGSSGLSDAKKIRMAFNFMTELPPPTSTQCEHK